MQPDELSLNPIEVYIDGQKIGEIKQLNIENKEEPKDIKVVSFKSFEGSFKLKEKSRKKLVRWIRINLENTRLTRIFNKTKKLRVKKKLAGRINRNVYKLMN